MGERGREEDSDREVRDREIEILRERGGDR